MIDDDSNSDSVQTGDSPRLTTVENPTLITTTNHQVVKLQLNATSSSHTELSSSNIQLLLIKAQNLFENGKKRFSFDDPSDLNDDEYRLLTSLSRDNFNEFVQITSSSTIRPSCNRSIRTAIGIYLCKLRLGISNRLLACMFQIADKRTVSRIINNVIDRHTTAIARELMCGGDSTDAAIIIFHETYLYIQSMMIVTTTDYVVACIVPFMSDFNNSDAAIMKDILLRNTDNILSWLKEYDILVADRGFRDSIGVMKVFGLEATIPSFLDDRRQCSAEEANESRCIRKIRWVVEAANHCLKQFKYFANTLQNSSLVYLESDMSIACALINHYQPPMTRSKLEDEEIDVQIMQLRQQKNKIQLLLEENNLIRLFSLWEIINLTEIIDGFPIMTQDGLEDLTFGVLQLKRTRSYVEERCSTTNLTSDVAYSVRPYIELLIIQHFTDQAILGWWCDCFTGARFLGSCSHIASAI
ncbi:unnamed protein product [Rotaria socialis]|uniref:DDE Tnp4 domain-containing protein n=1 Tax=Rotaria socialis TaxID=392032 RepID=A0A821J8U9_9BILA|nr:unnamed protein product [Rotaria socialis]